MDRKIFIDFDGTITKTDSCAAMVEAFAAGGWEEINKLWEEKELSTEECANRTFQLFHATPEDIGKLLDTLEVDEFFIPFLSFCRTKGIDPIILSDGYDFNIRTILQRIGVDMTFYANKMMYEPGKGFRIETPYANPSCGKCGTCKTTLINRLKGKNSQVLYIGDGHSDMCPAAVADVVFAKGVLYRYCREQGIPAIFFESFEDILKNRIWEEI